MRCNIPKFHYAKYKFRMAKIDWHRGQAGAAAVQSPLGIKGRHTIGKADEASMSWGMMCGLRPRWAGKKRQR
jgi:hypothetical protein